MIQELSFAGLLLIGASTSAGQMPGRGPQANRDMQPVLSKDIRISVVEHSLCR